MKHFIKYVIVTILVVVVVSSAAVAFAAQGDREGPGGPGGRGAGGEVTAIEGVTIQVKNPRGEMAIVTGEDTEFTINGEAGSLADIEVGMFVHAQGEADDDGTFTASRVFATDEARRPRTAVKIKDRDQALVVTGNSSG